MALASEAVGAAGIFASLRELEGSEKTVFPAEDVLQIMKTCGVSHPDVTLADLVAAHIVHREDFSFSLTAFGIRTFLLLEAINGADLQEVWRRLSRIDPNLRNYELIQEGMTRSFLRNICDRPGFRRLYICSPWIYMEAKDLEMLTHALTRAEGRGRREPELLVITRPEEGTIRRMPETVRPLMDLGASVYLHRRLHTKLYIREPDSSGGYAMAIIGSQNLTRSRYLELGIRINSDGTMINRLIAYFLDLANHCAEV